MLNSHHGRVFLLSIMTIGLMVLMTTTIWRTFDLAHEIKALEDTLTTLNRTTQILDQEYATLEADYALNQNSARLDRLQQSNLPELQRPERFLKIDDIPFLSPQPLADK
ncbi:MAG: hypothetical protein HRT36_06830 [Alphaproteobacteria bacterium]|nr:hypothetical protein [Alphaproteobacteria bacterium]